MGGNIGRYQPDVLETNGSGSSQESKLRKNLKSNETSMPDASTDEKDVWKRRRKPLHGTTNLAGAGSDTPDAWISASEQVIQYSIRHLGERYITNTVSSDFRDLESMVFAQMLTKVCSRWKEAGLHLPHQLAVFEEPVGLIAFQVHQRSYKCIKYAEEATPNGDDFLSDLGKSYEAIIDRLAETYSSKKTVLENQPTTPELLSHLFDHLLEEFSENGSGATRSKEGDLIFHDVHPARRSSIRDWQRRVEEFYTEKYDHEEEGEAFYSYPYVDVLVPDGAYLLAVFVSPLDTNFVDEKVDEEHRCAEITLAIFDVEKSIYPGATEELTPYLKQAFSHVLFSHMHFETSRALAESIEAQSTILRYWVAEAAEGYQNLMGEDFSKRAFDGMKFCEEVVRQILCADIPGVRSEVYPFDRAIIFREAGIMSRFDQEVPMEVLVLEASILSNNPADRGRYLTKRERRIRSTEDYECDASKKMIQKEDSYRFYLHSHKNGLIFSRKKVLTEEEKRDAARSNSSRYSLSNAEKRTFFIELTNPDEDDGEFSIALHNLFGRLVPSNYQEKVYFDPADPDRELFKIFAFTNEFERRRLEVTERYDERGLYFFYDHGIHMAQDIPILHRLQLAYSHFLDLHSSDLDEQFRREVYRQDNLDENQISKLLRQHRKKQRQIRNEESRLSKDDSAELGEEIKTKAARAVYISFSWMLHDENMANLTTRGSSDSSGGSAVQALLNQDYKYTMILIADNDVEKSLAQLNAERENLRLYFQMMMHRIWVDKQIEFEYLQKRSRSISDSLDQFFHRTINLIEDPARCEEIQELRTRLKPIMQPGQIVTERKEFNLPEEVFAALLDNESSFLSESSINEGLNSQSEKWFKQEIKEKGLDIRAALNNIPKVTARWPMAVVGDAFYVVFKNACEAALGAATNKNSKPSVIVNLQLVPTNLLGDGDDWFLDVVVENTGGPIRPSLLAILNAEEPRAIDPNANKSRSNGVGVYITRFQLHNVVGRGAEVFFINVGEDKVQTRLRLPVEVDTVVMETETPLIPLESQTSPRGHYVLYVEDEKKIYSEVVPELKDALLPFNVRLEHRRGYKEAAYLVDRKMPRAVLSDLTIYKDEIQDETANQRNGIKFLESVLETASANKSKPPIWVLTAEEESTVSSQMSGVADSGYRFVPADEMTAEQLAGQGIICVFPNLKRPLDLDRFPAFLEALLGDREPILNIQHKAGMIEDFLMPVPLRSDAFGNLAAIQVERFVPHQKRTLLVQDQCTDYKEIGEAITLWFNHPGIPFINEDIREKGVLRHLNNAVWHKELLLNIVLPEEVFKRLPIQIKYWAMFNNIWFSSGESDPAILNKIWLEMQQEERGPLSKLRHDISNQWKNPDLNFIKTTMLELIRGGENILRFSEEELRQMDHALASGPNSGAQLSKFLKTLPYKENDRIQLRQILGDLTLQAISAGDVEPELKTYLNGQRTLLLNLETYLTGG